MKNEAREKRERNDKKISEKKRKKSKAEADINTRKSMSNENLSNLVS